MQLHLVCARRHRHLSLLPRLVQAAGLERPSLLSHVLACSATKEILSATVVHLPRRALLTKCVAL